MMKKGFSMIEVILAAAIFVIFASAIVKGLIGGLDSNRLAAEQVVARAYASEGIEAIRSIRNQTYTSMANTSPTTGIARTANIWAYSGLNNIFDSRYTRTITVTSVNRDATGNIVVAPTGFPDSQTKKVESKVVWNFTATRPEEVTLTSYLTDWRSTISNAVTIYGDTGNPAQPRTRTYNDATNLFSAEGSTGTSFTDTVTGTNIKIKTSPVRREAITGYVNTSGVLRILCYDGVSWTSEFTTTVGGFGANEQRFGIAYETNSGDAMVVYSTNASSTNEMEYRTKSGSSGCGAANWSSATGITPLRTFGAVLWIRMESNPLAASNNIALAWVDNTNKLSAMQWTGSGFTIAEPAAALETNIERVGSNINVPSFDLAFESVTGNLMIVWGLNQATTCTAGAVIAATNCIRYARYVAAWSAVAVIPTVADPATNIDISANPNSNQLALAAVDDNQADLSLAYWSGSVWTGVANVDITSQIADAGTKLVTTGWLISGATTRWVAVYNDAATTNIGWYVCVVPATCTVQTDFAPTPVFANPQKWYDIQMDPRNKDRLMFLTSDNGLDLFAKRLVMTAVPAFSWTNADGGAALETVLGQATSAPYAFSYWRNP